MNKTTAAVIEVKRPVYQLEDLHDVANDGDPDHTACKWPEKTDEWSRGGRRGRSFVRRMMPSVDWLFDSYDWSDDFVKDLVAGFTVAVMNIPQGMAYALLANVEPSVGLYTAILPAIVYGLLGTSRHVSMGSFSVVCLMTGKVVSKYASDGAPYTPIDVATAVTLMVGLVQTCMYVMRMGAACAVLSETLVSGFTAAAGVHVVTSQIKELLGVPISGHDGLFQIVLTYSDVFKRIGDVNVATLAVSCITLLLLLAYNMFVKTAINKRSPVPVPAELITLIIGMLFFEFSSFAEDHQIKLIGEVERRLPGFRMPPLNLLTAVFWDSVMIAIISYSMTTSMALLFSEKLKYGIDTNQELLAQGASNVCGAFFSCLPSAASLSRSVTQQSVGGRTQMAGIVSAGLLVAVVMWLGHLFRPLPRSMLAGITVVALKDILLQVSDVVTAWRRSRADAAVWIVTYATVVLMDIDIGLLAGVILSLLLVFQQTMDSGIVVLGRIPDTDVYVDAARYGKAVEVPRVRIVRYSGSLNLTNRNAFKVNMQDVLCGMCDVMPASAAPAKTTVVQVSMTNGGDCVKETAVPTQKAVCCVVFDLAGMHFIDTSGLSTFAQLIQQLGHNGVSVHLAALSGPVYDTMLTAHQFGAVRFFPSVHDAVEYNNTQDVVSPTN